MNNIGILDPEGNNPNPITGRPFSDVYKEEAKIWRMLPAYSDPRGVIQKIRDNQVIVAMAGTGSGKTVLVPKYVMHVNGYQGKVVVTVPKRALAKSHAIYSSMLLDVDLGNQVGYKYQGSDSSAYNAATTNLLFATDGTILQNIFNDAMLSEYNAVIIDEAHERSVNIDLLLYMLKEPLRKRPDFKVIIISATIDPKIFENYYSDFKTVVLELGAEPNFPIEQIFLKYELPPGDYMRKSVEILDHIVNTDNIEDPGPHGVIIFVTARAETFKLCELIHQKFKTLFCGEYTAGLDKDREEYLKDEFKYEETGKTRKIIVATNAAESSVTFKGAKFVIDGGYELKGSFNPTTNANVLERELISQAQAKQRMGRVGRKAPGVVYHLYTRYMYNHVMLPYPKSSVSVSNLYSQALILLSKEWIHTVDNLVNVLMNDFLEPPSEIYMLSAINQLMILNLTDKEAITNMGMAVANSGLDPQAGRAMLLAYKIGCFEEVAIIITMMDETKFKMDGILREPKKQKDKELEKKIAKQYEKVKHKFSHRYGDHLTLLNIYNQYIESENKKEFMKENFIKPKSITRIKEKYKTLMRQAHMSFREEHGGVKFMAMALDDRIIASLAFGYKLNRASATKRGYSTEVVDHVNINKDSFLVGNHPSVFYGELFKTSGRYSLNIVSSIPKRVQEILKVLN